MSQTAPVRAVPRGASRPKLPVGGRRLTVVAPPPTRGNGLFLVLCAALLVGGFIGVLMLNTAMAQGSYTMRDLQRQSDELADTQDELRQAIESVSGPGPLAKEARALGMVPSQSAAFLRLSDGKVLGVATPAQADATFRVETEARTAPARTTAAPAPQPTPTPTTSSTASPTATPTP